MGSFGANAYSQKPWKAHYSTGITDKLPPSEFFNLPDMIHKSSKLWSSKKAYTLVLPNGAHATQTFAQINEHSDDLAVYIREVAGLQKGDRIAIQMPNCLAYPISVFGVLKAGCVIVNTNPLYTPSEIEHQLKDSGASAIIIIDMFVDKLVNVLKNTEIKKVIVVSIADFFNPVKKVLIASVLKYVKRQIPTCKFPHEKFAKVVVQGNKVKAYKNINVSRYWDKIGSDELCALQYTGGTTGVSKGAMLTHKNILSNMGQILEMGKTRIQAGQDTIMTILPLYHIFAFTLNLITFYCCGGHNILVPNPRPLLNVKKAFELFPVTWLSGVNTLFNGLLNEKWFQNSPPKSLKAAVAGGAALHEAVAKRWEMVTKTPVVEGFGLTETSPVVTFNPIGGGVVKQDTVGIPVPGTEITLVDDSGKPSALGQPGEIAVKGPQVMLGYWKRPEETAKVFLDGWLLTGDVGVMDSDGYFKIVDRKKDMILVSGFNVYPNEVEDCLAKHPGIQEAAVIGVPSEQTGETVKAYVVKKDPMLSEKQVLDHCYEFLTGYKVPKQIEFRKELPKTPIGKILRKELRNTNRTVI